MPRRLRETSDFVPSCSSRRFCLRSSISSALNFSGGRAAPLPIFTGLESGLVSPSVSAAFPDGCWLVCVGLKTSGELPEEV